MWNEPARAQALGKEKVALELVVETIVHLEQGSEDVAGLIELAVEAEDQETFDEAESELAELIKKLETLEFRRMFSGPNDANDGYIDNEGTTFYRWGGSPPGRQANKIIATNATVDADVVLSLPADSTVRVQSGNQIEIPLTITPKEGVLIAGFEFEIEFKVDELDFIDMKTDVLPGPWFTYVNLHEPLNGWQRVSFGGIDYSPSNSPETYHIDKKIDGLKLLFRADFPDAEWTSAPIRFVGKHAAGTPAARDLLMDRQDGEVLVWNKYWAFGGGEPDDSEITYNYPNPFVDNTTFQFYVGKSEDVKLYILNSMGQRVGTLLNENVLAGLHTFDFTNEPSVWIPEVSVYESHKTLEPGVYIFVLETKTRLKSSKFTVVK